VWNLVLHAAFITLAVQACLFPVLVALVLVELTRGSVSTTFKPQVESGASIEEKPNAPPLEPWTCRNCGAGLVLEQQQTPCPRCGAAVALPAEDAGLVRFRTAERQRLQRATTYLRRAIVVSTYSRRLFLLIALWLCAMPVVLIIGGGEFRTYDALIEPIGDWFNVSFYTLIVWIIVFFAARTRTPGIFLARYRGGGNIDQIEAAQCSACQGAIEYRKGDMATVCDRCATVSYRVRFAWQGQAAAQRAKGGTAEAVRAIHAGASPQERFAPSV
jgi:Zn finger protein HypA/HybF involved in hydrogenase expression